MWSQTSSTFCIWVPPKYLLGSVLALMVYTMLPETPKAKLDKVWSTITEYYRDSCTSCQCSHPQLSVFSAPQGATSLLPEVGGQTG